MLLALFSTTTHCCLLFSFLSAGIFRPLFLQPCSPCPVPAVAWDYFVLLARSCCCLHRNPEVPQESTSIIPVLQHTGCSPQLCAMHRLTDHTSPATGWLLEMLGLLATVPTPAGGILHLWTQPFEPGGPASFPLALTSIYSGQSYSFPYKHTTGDFDTGQSQSRPQPHSEQLSPHSIVIYLARSVRLL